MNCMLRFLKTSLVLVLLMAGAAPGAKAFSLLGPSKGWQVPLLGYNLSGDIGTPMLLNEEYRWNTPVITYAFDPSFSQYFGVRGMQSIDEAFAILNALPPLSSTSPTLTEFSQTDMLRRNHQAAALGLLDLKSTALQLIVEELGLADPVRWAWSLRARNVQTLNNVNYTNYTVIQMNYDPVTWMPTHAVNGALYGYTIIEGNRAGTLVAEAIELPLDEVPNSAGNPTPVAGNGFGFGAGPGNFWIGLTRDDVGGLKYIYRTNNINTEQLLPGSLIAVTNRTTQLVLTNQDLRTFEMATTSTTNSPAALLGLYPNLQILSTNARLAISIETNILSFFTNLPPQQVTVTNMVTNIVTIYDYTFGNVVTNFADGSFHIVPQTLLGFELVANLLTNVVAVTNVTPTLNMFVNTNLQTLLSTIDLVTFTRQARTNAPADLLAIYPDLIFLSTNMQIFTEVQTNFTFYLTNYAWAPATAPPAVVFVPELTNVLVTNWNYTFANVITNTFAAVGRVTIERMEVYPAAWSTDGRLTTNLIHSSYWSNFINGTVYIVPTNLLGFQFVRTLLTNVNVISNNLNPTVFGGTMVIFTNGTNLVLTNFAGTNLNASFTNVSELIFQTNYTYAVHPVEPGITLIESVSNFTNVISAVYPIEFLPPAGSVGMRPGVDKLHFLRVHFDSVTGLGYIPVTNQYFDTIITNSQPVRQVVRRIINQPDMLFLAQDLGVTGNLTPVLAARTSATNWVNNAALNTQGAAGGPGVIPPQIRFSFSNLLPYFSHTSSQFSFFVDFDPTFSNRSVVWGAFDGTTNAPVVFPSYLSIQMLENMILNPNP
jgi:hypothetical protein